MRQAVPVPELAAFLFALAEKLGGPQSLMLY